MSDDHDAADVATFGRHAEHPIERMDADERAARDLVMRGRGMVPGPYKIFIRNRALLEAIFPMAQHYQSNSSLSKGEIEIAVLLTTSKWMAAYATSEHEWLAQHFGGLSADTVEALVTGGVPSLGDPRQQLVYDLARTLLAPKIVSMPLYERAMTLLGDVGLTDVIAMIGYFTTVAMTLCAYDVPSHAEGLIRPGEPTIEQLKAKAAAARDR